MINRFFLLASLLITAAFSSARAAPPTSRPVPAIEHIMIVSIDGLRPDLALRANTPTLHAMIHDGSFTFWARTTAESVTLPSHTSMLTGVVPTRHGIQWNQELPLEHQIYPAFPTLFELAKKAGYSTAMSAGKSKFNTLAKPGTLDWQYVPKETSDDGDVTDHALEMIRDHQPDVLFVHLPGVDNAGHAQGWASPEQLAAIERADSCVGRLLGVLTEQKRIDSTMVIVTADHGGAGRSHGPDDPRSRHIPWLVIGPGIRKDLDLTTYAELTVDTEDTFCTACYVLGIHPPRLPLDGKPVMQIFDQSGSELIREAQP